MRAVLDEGSLSIKVWRARTEIHRADARYGKAAWSMEFTDSHVLDAWIMGYEQSVADRKRAAEWENKERLKVVTT